MTTQQHPTHSGFGTESTVSDVLDGVDLTGKLAIVTGGYSGIGLEHARGLTDAGATVIVPARRLDEATKQQSGVERVEVDELDLADIASVRGFAERFLHSDRGIDILVNGAGIIAPARETRVGPGWEVQFAVNHLGHFALTNHLWPALAAADGARVIAISSRGHKFSEIRWDNLDWEHDYDKWKAYGQSRPPTPCLHSSLTPSAPKWASDAFSVNPGGIRTPLQRHVSKEEELHLGWLMRTATTSSNGRPHSRAPPRRCGGYLTRPGGQGRCVSGGL